MFGLVAFIWMNEKQKRKNAFTVPELLQNWVNITKGAAP
jgi:hypothetical protein